MLFSRHPDCFAVEEVPQKDLPADLCAFIFNILLLAIPRNRVFCHGVCTVKSLLSRLERKHFIQNVELKILCCVTKWNDANIHLTVN